MCECCGTCLCGTHFCRKVLPIPPGLNSDKSGMNSDQSGLNSDKLGPTEVMCFFHDRTLLYKRAVHSRDVPELKCVHVIDGLCAERLGRCHPSADNNISVQLNPMQICSKHKILQAQDSNNIGGDGKASVANYQLHWAALILGSLFQNFETNPIDSPSDSKDHTSHAKMSLQTYISILETLQESEGGTLTALEMSEYKPES